MSGERMVVVATWAEAKRLGANSRGVDRVTGELYVSVAAGLHTIEGMRVASYRVTDEARRRKGASQVIQMLQHSVLKAQR